MKLLSKLSLVVIGFGMTFAAPLQAQEISYHYNKGEVMCLVSSINRPDNQSLKKAYFEGVGPLSEKLGFQFQGLLKMEKLLAGNHEAPLWAIIKLPNVQAKIDINGKYLPQWKQFRETRPDMWSEMVQREYEIPQTTDFTYDTDKYYQVETFWLQNDKEDEFSAYRMARESYHAKLNGRIFFETGSPSNYETLGTERAPSHTIITEWDSKNAFETYHKLTEAKPFKYLAGYNAWLMTAVPAQS